MYRRPNANSWKLPSNGHVAIRVLLWTIDPSVAARLHRHGLMKRSGDAQDDGVVPVRNDGVHDRRGRKRSAAAGRSLSRWCVDPDRRRRRCSARACAGRRSLSGCQQLPRRTPAWEFGGIGAHGPRAVAETRRITQRAPAADLHPATPSSQPRIHLPRREPNWKGCPRSRLLVEPSRPSASPRKRTETRSPASAFWPSRRLVVARTQAHGLLHIPRARDMLAFASDSASAVGRSAEAVGRLDRLPRFALRCGLVSDQSLSVKAWATCVRAEGLTGECMIPRDPGCLEKNAVSSGSGILSPWRKY